MRLGEREKKGIIILLALIYIYAFFQFNIKNAIPDIRDNNEKIAALSVRLEQLENDYNQISERKRELERYKTANVRYSDYIAQNADSIEIMEYIERVKRLFNGKISGVSFDAPWKNEKSDPQYYEFSTKFNAEMTLTELVNFMNFIESGTRKVKITKFLINPKVLGDSNNETVPVISDSVPLEVSMALTMYSMELESIEKMYEISRNKFEKFIGVDGIVILPPADGKLGGGGDKVVINLNGDSKGGGTKPLPPVSKRTDIHMVINSFLFGGPNFSVKGINSGKSENFYLKTKLRQDVVIRLNNSTYSIVTSAVGGRTRKINGNFPKHNIVLRCSTAITNIPDNANLGANIKIINDSDYYISIIKQGVGSDRVKVYDRSGNKVELRNDSDKIIIM